MAIKLEDIQNVNAPNATWPFGEVRDKTPALGGTKYNKEAMSDMFQFFAKLMSESGISHNNVLDNENNGFQLFDALRKITRPYNVYSALVTQSGTSAPTVDVLENTLSGSVTWARTAAGSYTATLAGEFSDADKVGVFVAGSVLDTETIAARANNDSILLVTHKIGDPLLTNIDGKLANSLIEIRVYD